MTVAFCPSPPLLLPAVGGTATSAASALRAAVLLAVESVLAERPDVLVVVGVGGAGRAATGARALRFGPGDAGDLRGYGIDLEVPFAGRARPGGQRLPLAHTVGAWLLDHAGHIGPRLGVGPDGLAPVLAELPASVGVLAMGEGSARRSDKAPGHLDPAAAGFDATVAAALAGGDAAALAALDPQEGEHLLAAGVPVWRAVGAALGGRPVVAGLRYDDAPFGVGYLVAEWHLP
ncbi:class III extradiol dioxygenase subunit B-like domain-containing protein [Modestobacter lapidis]